MRGLAEKAIREANGCTVNAWEEELSAFKGAFETGELEDVPPEVVRSIRKAISAHQDAILLLEAALPKGRGKGGAGD